MHLADDGTGICVLFTCADPRHRVYKVFVHKDCVADFSPAAHAFALEHMTRIPGAKLL